MKKYSGKFVLRIPDHLHAALMSEAQVVHLSLNSYCRRVLERRFESKKEKAVFEGDKKVLAALKKKFHEKLLSVVLFGSTATGQATSASDIDLLVVLDESVALERALYRWWDEQSFFSRAEINAHFVHVPPTAFECGGLWLEVATEGKIIFDRALKTERFLTQARRQIEQGFVRRYWSHGHPYWQWRTHEEQITG